MRSIRSRYASVLLAAAVVAGSVFLVSRGALPPVSAGEEAHSARQPAKIAIDYPLNGSVFPPEITAPVFLWRDPIEAAKRWVVEVSFADHSQGIRIEAAGEPFRRNEIDVVLVATGVCLFHRTRRQQLRVFPAWFTSDKGRFAEGRRDLHTTGGLESWRRICG